MPRYLPILAVLESSALVATVWRFSTLGFAFANTAQLVWFIVTLMLASSSVALFVVRATQLKAKQAAGEPVDDEQKQALGFSIALIGLAILSAIAGVPLFERLLG